MKYAILVKANINTVWEADNEEQALDQAEVWTAEEYGDLVHNSIFEVKEIL
jgi:hypothetical protein